MQDRDWLAERFEANRPQRRSVAFRMLGSSAEAEDAVQEAWINLSRSGANGVENLDGWMTRIVARVCLDMLRSRKSRREQPMDELMRISSRRSLPPHAVATSTRCWRCSIQVVLRADDTVVRMGDDREVVGASAGGRIVGIEMLADPERLGQVRLTEP